VKKAEIKSRTTSSFADAEKLVDTLTKERFWFVAYLESAGDKNHPDFRSRFLKKVSPLFHRLAQIVYACRSLWRHRVTF